MKDKLKERKKEVLAELARIQHDEERANVEAIKAANYESFMSRCQDWIIGQAHAQFDLQDNGGPTPKGERLDGDVLPSCVSIQGNCSSSYPSVAQVTSATSMYFHNVIPDNYRSWFTKRILGATKELMEKVLKSPKCVLEIMGLQSNAHWNNTKYFKEEDIPKIQHEIERAQDEVLGKFSTEELQSCGRLSHGGSILTRHLTARGAIENKENK